MSLPTASQHYELRIEGNLNPSILTSKWYSKHFAELEAKGSSTPAHSFTTLGNLSINCDFESWVAGFSSEDQLQEAISVADKVFSELLAHTPIHEASLVVFSKWANDSWHSKDLVAKLFADGLVENAADTANFHLHWTESGNPVMNVLFWTCKHPTHLHTCHTFAFPLSAGESIKNIIADADNLSVLASDSAGRIVQKIFGE